MIRKLVPVVMILFSGILFAQTETDSAQYMQGIDMLNKAKTQAELLQAGRYFDTLSEDKREQWLVHYYSGLSYILAGQKSGDKKKMDQLLDVAQLRIDKSARLKPGEPEIEVLQAFLYQIRLQVDPQSRAISFAQKAEASLKKAMAADPENPRAYFLLGNNIYYTPPVFKGGPKNALPLFLKAREKFNGYVADQLYMPDWGRKQNEEMIRMCQTSKN